VGLIQIQILFYQTNIVALCDEIIKIGKRFARDNNFEKVYLSSQEGYTFDGKLSNYSALSDRDRVYEYLMENILKKGKKESWNFILPMLRKFAKFTKYKNQTNLVMLYN